MDRIDELRTARTSPQVIFSEYLKLKSRGIGIVVVYEGKQCPAFYHRWVMQAMNGTSLGQIIARGKKNVLALRDLIARNPRTAADVTIYFVDRDYDDAPKPGELPDVYVTRGYALENELVNWATVEQYIRACFDIANADDQLAMAKAQELFEKAFEAYIVAATDLHMVIYVCRAHHLPCTPGEEISDYISFDWEAATASRKHESLDSLLAALGVSDSDRTAIHTFLEEPSDFSKLSPILEWRGKFHYTFVKKYLMHLSEMRRSGRQPFSRRAKIDVDPGHPSTFTALASFSAQPRCLAAFLEGFKTSCAAVSRAA